MRLLGRAENLVLALVMLSPAMFAQARGGRTAARRPAAAPARTAAPGPALAPVPGPVTRPVGGAGAVPVGFFGYYPNPLYYGDAGYVDPNAPAPAAPPGDNGGPLPNGVPPPAYYGADPSGQGYPTVLINPNYTPQTANPVIRDYSFPSDDNGANSDAAQAATTASVFFLIAMKDQTIYPAIAYWVQDDKLNYITPQGVRNTVSLGLVDRDFSVRLNKDRNVDFALPDPKAN